MQPVGTSVGRCRSSPCWPNEEAGDSQPSLGQWPRTQCPTPALQGGRPAWHWCPRHSTQKGKEPGPPARTIYLHPEISVRLPAWAASSPCPPAKGPSSSLAPTLPLHAVPESSTRVLPTLDHPVQVSSERPFVPRTLGAIPRWKGRDFSPDHALEKHVFLSTQTADLIVTPESHQETSPLALSPEML